MELGIDHFVASRLQTIGDVAVARMGTVAVVAGDGDSTPVIDALTDSALANHRTLAKRRESREVFED